jgi:hypothetical protein
MDATVTTLALVGIAGTGIIYGTDGFSALVLRPAASQASDSSVADLIGRIHHYGDQRLPVPGVAAIVAAALATGFAMSSTTRAAAGTALLALAIWLAIYLAVSAPVNKRLRAAAPPIQSHPIPEPSNAAGIP